MLNFFKHALGFVFSGLSDLWRNVLSVIHSVYSVLQSSVHWLYHWALNSVNHAIELARAMGRDLANSILFALQWAEHAISDVESWVDKLVGYLKTTIDDVYHWAINAYLYLEKAISKYVAELYSWMVNNIWNPIWARLTSLESWATKYINYLWNVVTHPQILAEMLIAYLFSFWLQLLAKYAKPVIAYMLGHWKSVIGPLFHVIEDIITSVL